MNHPLPSIEFRENGFYICYEGKEIGPYKKFEEIDSVDVSNHFKLDFNLDLAPKEILSLKLKNLRASPFVLSHISKIEDPHAGWQARDRRCHRKQY